MQNLDRKSHSVGTYVFWGPGIAHIVVVHKITMLFNHLIVTGHVGALILLRVVRYCLLDGLVLTKSSYRLAIALIIIMVVHLQFLILILYKL